ncbi:MAG: hypothetical protein A2798_02470 [Candidatus Levybacteria bacterium RIFCSPHIGHO2_01_FULL_37_17]|nr:MAG: hypothetical protein A2798_02470 [Candidatus Levybacteria bacterium RIFCSPHIGHO2_01_FULL_37_17]OGH36735.1 MAG: hypothetical protein A2959_00460 [Candidatus Levybacteria bacterium RIFCSPLOWO2_01_FULL_38_23]
MGERGPSFESFESRHSPEREPHKPELQPDVICEAEVTVASKPTTNNLLYLYNAVGLLNCDSCPLREHLSGRGETSDDAIEMAKNRARSVVRDNCMKWKILSQATVSYTEPMPDSFLPRDLQ